MMRVSVVLAIATSWFPGSSIVAQTRPDFSGKWTTVTSLKLSGRDVPPGFAGTVTIEQTATTLTLTDDKLKITYNLDGKDTPHRIEPQYVVDGKVVRGQSIRVESKAKWDRERLVINVIYDDDMANTSRGHRLYLDETGNLIIENWSYSSRDRVEHPRVVYKKR